MIINDVHKPLQRSGNSFDLWIYVRVAHIDISRLANGIKRILSHKNRNESFDGYTPKSVFRTKALISKMCDKSNDNKLPKLG